MLQRIAAVAMGPTAGAERDTLNGYMAVSIPYRKHMDMQHVWRCRTPAVIPGAAPPRPMLGKGRRISPKNFDCPLKIG